MEVKKRKIERIKLVAEPRRKPVPKPKQQNRLVGTTEALVGTAIAVNVLGGLFK